MEKPEVEGTLVSHPGGTLTGAEPRTSPTEPTTSPTEPTTSPTEPATFFQKSGTARDTFGSDTIEFGSGSFGSARVGRSGEDDSWPGDQLRAEGLRIDLTGVTPFRPTLVIR